MYEILLVVYLLAALAVIGLVLVQHGKGADMGASFGAGASNSVFGATGSGNFLTHATAIFATVFFILSLVLGNLSTKQANEVGEFENLSVPTSVNEIVVEPATNSTLESAANAGETQTAE